VDATTTRASHRRNAYKIGASIAIAATAAAVAGLGTFGTFTSSTDPTPVAIQDGTVSIDLTAGDGSASVPLSFTVSPGTSTTRNVNLVNDGSAGLHSIGLATVATSSSILDSDPTNGLQMQVDDCSVAWAADGTCAGVQRTVLASGPAVRTGTLANPFGLAAGATDHLAVTLGLPTSAGDAFKAQSSGLSLTFTATQRDGGPR
jgi:Camelysin metallo-endopeptidase